MADAPGVQGTLLVRNTVLNLIGYVVPLLVGLVTIPYVVRGLGNEGFGILSIAWVLLVSSALAGEGKTTTTLNLGMALSSLGGKVVVVDGDMRRPACHRATGVKNSPGFVQCLTGRVELSEAVLLGKGSRIPPPCFGEMRRGHQPDQKLLTL